MTPKSGLKFARNKIADGDTETALKVLNKLDRENPGLEEVIELRKNLLEIMAEEARAEESANEPIQEKSDATALINASNVSQDEIPPLPESYFLEEEVGHYPRSFRRCCDEMEEMFSALGCTYWGDLAARVPPESSLVRYYLLMRLMTNEDRSVVVNAYHYMPPSSGLLKSFMGASPLDVVELVSLFSDGKVLLTSNTGKRDVYPYGAEITVQRLAYRYSPRKLLEAHMQRKQSMVHNTSARVWEVDELNDYVALQSLIRGV